jgi:hypothetical protein
MGMDAKRAKTSKCVKCEREFSTLSSEYRCKVYVHHGAVVCENRLIGVGTVLDSDADTARLYNDGSLYRVV